MLLVQKADCIEITAENASLRNVNIYNSSGALIATRHGNATDKVVFPVGIFPSGIYLVKSGYLSKRFIIKH